VRLDFLRPTILFCGLAFLVSCGKQEPASSNPMTGDLNVKLVSVPASNAASPYGLGRSSEDKPVDNESRLLLVDPKALALQDALRLESQGRLDSALERVNSVLQVNSKNSDAYCVRGQIYSRMKRWDLAQADIEAILQIDDKNSVAKFNLVELKFMQKAYNDARPGFIAMEQDPDLGDLAAYKVFLCDLFGGHEDVAQSELDVFNKTGENPSFYFANAAWCLYHKRPEDARGWLNSAGSIYEPWKASRYSSSLSELGYLPLPPLAK
jgi:tetratricopeptide (TPR) repeat protein